MTPCANPPIALTIDHAGASVADLEQSIRFYSDVFGFTIAEQFVIDVTGVRGAVLHHHGGARIELFSGPATGTTDSRPSLAVPTTARWFQVAFRVDDAVAAHANAVAAGAVSVADPFIAPDGTSWVAFVADPDGNLIELIQRA